MLLLLLSVCVFVASGLAAVFAQRSARLASGIGVAGAIVGASLGIIPTLRVLLGGESESLRLAWQVPYGAFFVEIDPLSAWFLLPILGLSAIAAIYGGEYLMAYRDTKRLGAPWFFFNLLAASMTMVVIARNGVLFLVSWEVMSLASFFLVTFEDEKEEVREAGWTYLVATHLGTAFLLALFILLGREAGSLDFDQFGATGALAPATATLLFLLALIGFGTKAGFMPLHVWLPEAHPAAPSHVSAVMSGVMIKTGIYGILRTLTFLGTPPAWWGWLLIGIGLTSGIGGVLFALAQRDLKRLLAYSSVENIGIIALAMGVGVLGLSAGSTALVVFGFGGALLHVLNHALFKGLLFLGAGVVLHGTGTRQLDQLGGLLKRMPSSGAAFLVGAAAISALPPLNGFIGEFLIYVGAFRGATSLGIAPTVPLLATIAGLGLIGGLAAACFTRAFGISFLGEPRSDDAAHAHDAGWTMRGPMWCLAALCLLIGLFAPVVVKILWPVIAALTGLPSDTVQAALADAAGPLWLVAAASTALLALIVTLAALRRWLLAGRDVGESGTWGCGYARPTVRMQYTATSFSQPLTDLFRAVLGTRKQIAAPAGYFPRDASLSTETPDLCRQVAYRPLFLGIDRGLSRLRWLQHGNVHLYVLYIALTLVVLLVWKLGKL